MFADYYYEIYLSVLFCVLLYLVLNYDSSQIKARGSESLIPSFVLFIIISLFIGLRPHSGVFVDTLNYKMQFENLKGVMLYVPKSDKLFRYFTYYSSQIMSVSEWFLIISIVYFGGMLYSCRRLVPKDTLFAFVVCLSAYSCFAYGTNGLRNGMATSIAMLALTYRDRKFISVALLLLASGIHLSMLLIFVSSIISYIFKNTKIYIIVWILCIFISIFVSGFFETLFAGFIEDDRTDYLTLEGDVYGGDGGFRWDFLLYSSMPILVGYYFVVLRKISDEKYKWILNTYIISNTFWVLVMRASFSNRFAYLSWFLYPIVLIYPFLKFHYVKNQYKKTSLFAFLHFCFTYFMMLIGK